MCIMKRAGKNDMFFIFNIFSIKRLAVCNKNYSVLDKPWWLPVSSARGATPVLDLARALRCALCVS